jgi:hypothetical protein
MAVVAAALVRSLAEELARGARELGATLVAGNYAWISSPPAQIDWRYPKNSWSSL